MNDTAAATTAPVNPCQDCPDICCALKGDCGLRLAPEEFAAHFKAHEQDLNVRQENGYVIISTREGLVCPNLGAKGCSIYAERPIDCRLYPYQMLPVYETRRRVRVMLYLTPECVGNRTFRISEQEARGLVESFCRKAYGDKKIIIRIFVDRFLPKLRNKCAILFFRVFSKLGVDL